MGERTNETLMEPSRLGGPDAVPSASMISCLPEAESAALALVALKNSFDAVGWVDSRARFVQVNSRFVELLALSEEHILGQHMSLINPAVTEEFWVGHWASLVVEGKRRFEMQLLRGDGRPIEVELHEHFMTVGGEPFACAIIRDLSDRKALERERLKAASLSNLVALGEMAAGVAHEINNPLAIIAGHCDVARLALEQPPPDPHRVLASLEKIRATTERIARIVRTLRALTRDEAGGDPGTVCVQDVVVDLFELVGQKVRSRGIALGVFLPQEPLQVRGSATQLSQILVNLVGNAMDALEPVADTERWIELHAEAEGGDRVTLRVVDGGPGVPEAVAGRIMEPFFTTKPPGKGTGLGLSISHGLALGMGGELTYEARAPRTTFRLRLVRSKPGAEPMSEATMVVA